MTYWRCYYHLVWATKHRAAWITAAYEPLIVETIQIKTAEFGGRLLAVNMVVDHVHAALSLPPTVALAQCVQRLKGVSAYEINHQFPDALETFRWQEGYSVHTFGERDLDIIIAYIQRQKEHHANDDLLAYLERME